jgi:hypothetical protein
MTNDKPHWAADVSEEAEERRQKLAELSSLQERVDVLEAELVAMKPPSGRFPGYYTAYYATSGFLLGMFGACTSLLFNVVGSLLFFRDGGPEHNPLRLIQVYLTFPLGERALSMESGLALAVGCCLYLATGMILGMLFQLILSRFVPNASFVKRLVVTTVLSLALWIINFYGILSWLQPLLFGGRWIVDLIPPWVAAATHLVFGWTMALVYPWGLYVPYQVESE